MLEYFSKQPLQYPIHRQYAVNWMAKLADKVGVLPDTLVLGVGLMDRYISLDSSFYALELKQVGITSLILATKSNSIGGLLGIENFTSLTEVTCSVEEIIPFERKILRKVNNVVSTPTTLTFFWAFARVITESPANFEKIISLGNYLAELALLDIHMVDCLPSLVAASLVFLSRLTLGMMPWNKTLQQFTGYPASELQCCVERLYNWQRGLEFLEFRKKHGCEPFMIRKYSKEKYHSVARLPAVNCIPKECFKI